MPQFLKGLVIIMLLFAVGEFISFALNIPVPGNVIGMLFMFAGLQYGLIKRDAVEGISKQLIGLLNLFFIPAGVGLLAYESLLKDNLLVIVLASVLSSLIVMAVAASVFLYLKKR
ncbi:CidA/LrgA family protein [Chondrinema litorale]|uniref:CidA/LrgA family protein n=1 Tax=Chondrinema litorale TaxID=2994555 RepID=UPI00254283E2|nr:CidA/LrgA family protein [Chondrinema litorale]UZR95126.1 CidA/LrgA family protein [Chondrinema litorale]